MPTIHRAYLGVAAVTAPLPFFLEDPQRYWWLSLLIGLGLALIGDDIIYHVSNGRVCLLCKWIPE